MNEPRLKDLHCLFLNYSHPYGLGEGQLAVAIDPEFLSAPKGVEEVAVKIKVTANSDTADEETSVVQLTAMFFAIWDVKGCLTKFDSEAVVDDFTKMTVARTFPYIREHIRSILTFPGRRVVDIPMLLQNEDLETITNGRDRSRKASKAKKSLSQLAPAKKEKSNKKTAK